MGIISTTPEPIGFGSRIPPPFVLQVAASGIEGDPDPSHYFDLFNLTMSNALKGQTFTLESGPLFERFAQFMTDGRQADVAFLLRDSAGGSGGLFSRKINFSPGSPNGVDLQGSIIEGCDLTIVDYEDLGPQPNGLFNARGEVTFTIRGWNAIQATRAALTQIILFGVTQDAAGVVIRPGSGPVPVGPWGWESLSPADQQTLMDMALRQVTRVLTRMPGE